MQQQAEERELLHDVYLPVTEAQLRKHFVDTSGGKAAADRHLTYYRKSLRGLRALDNLQAKTSTEAAQEIRRGRQLEKDERFWGAAALLALFHPPESRVSNLALLMKRSVAERPPWAPSSTWEQQLDGTLHLFFEVNLPAPRAYKDWLTDRLDERTLVPYVREAAGATRARMEGTTKVDAMILAPKTGCAVAFEVKVLSDASPMTKYDVLRNQIARTIDVTLERPKSVDEVLSSRRPTQTCVVLLTPEIFRSHRESRLYGRIFDEYRKHPQGLDRDLPHRNLGQASCSSIAARLGWATFEDCRRIVPAACAWLPVPSPSAPTDVTGAKDTAPA